VDEDAVRARLLAVPGVVDVHDLHIWALSTTETALSAHVVSTSESAASVRTLGAAIRTAFPIHHITLQTEANGGYTSPVSCLASRRDPPSF
jgi:cobalt-zinc-cadmium efflux system protein